MDAPTEYCERLLSLGIEPFNTVSNIAFLAAAIFAFRLIRKQTPQGSYLLPILLGSAGAASAWWHTAHSHYGDIADTVFIGIFATVAGFLFLRRITGSSLSAGLILAPLFAVVLTLEQLSYLNGSLPYVALLAGFAVAGISYVRKYPSSRHVVLATAVLFAVAIAFRTLDPVVCPYLPIGTHFLWHMLMALLGYQLIMLIARDYSAATAKTV